VEPERGKEKGLSGVGIDHQSVRNNYFPFLFPPISLVILSYRTIDIYLIMYHQCNGS
jgi:hypothetical protein